MISDMVNVFMSESLNCSLNQHILFLTILSNRQGKTQIFFGKFCFSTEKSVYFSLSNLHGESETIEIQSSLPNFSSDALQSSPDMSQMH